MPLLEVSVAVVKCDEEDCFERELLDSSSKSLGRCRQVFQEMGWTIDIYSMKAWCKKHKPAVEPKRKYP